jgi:hypothetical protein
VLCCYPASEQPQRKPRKATIADVAERLVRLERTLVAISSSDAHTEAGTETPGATEQIPPDDATGGDGRESVMEEFLLQNGDSSRYMNEILISRVLEEVSVVGWGNAVWYD